MTDTHLLCSCAPEYLIPYLSTFLTHRPAAGEKIWKEAMCAGSGGARAAALRTQGGRVVEHAGERRERRDGGIHAARFRIQLQYALYMDSSIQPPSRSKHAGGRPSLGEHQKIARTQHMD